jgi:hypothetical protein
VRSTFSVVRTTGAFGGPRVFGWHFGADTILVRRVFDRRFRIGTAKPRPGSLVTTSEIAALLKPPSGRCQSPVIARSRGWVLPAPREIPTYRAGTGLVRLGYVTDVNGDERLVGVPVRELLFSARFGKAGFGKTEEALVQAIEIARLGGGVWFLDPHADGWKRAKPYLSDPALRCRLWEVNLDVRGRSKRLPGWNPLSMQGFTESDIEDRVDAVVTSFDDEFAEHYHPEWHKEVDKALDVNLARRPIGEVLDELEDLDDRILSTLQAARPAPAPRRGRPPSRGSGAAVDLTSTVE